MNNKSKHLHKAKTWNLVSIIFKGIGLLITTIMLPSSLNPDKALYTIGIYGSDTATQEAYKKAIGIFPKLYTVANLLIGITVFVLLLLARKKLREELAPSKFAYFLYLIWMFISIIYGLFNTSSFKIPGVDNLGVYMTLFAILFHVVAALPIIITLYHSFKAEPEE